DAGSDLTRITTFAEHEGDRYRIRGRKVFISRVEQSDLMVLVARTSPLEEGAKRTEGLSLFLVDLREAKGIEHTPIRTMFNSQTYELSLDDLEVPAENRIGEEGKGFGVLVHVLNPERILIASECLGDARWFIDRSAAYAKQRVVFGRPIGSNQGIQFPLADAYARLVAADGVRWHAARLYESDADPKEVGDSANIAKHLASACSTRTRSWSVWRMVYRKRRRPLPARGSRPRSGRPTGGVGSSPSGSTRSARTMGIGISPPSGRSPASIPSSCRRPSPTSRRRRRKRGRDSSPSSRPRGASCGSRMSSGARASSRCRTARATWPPPSEATSRRTGATSP